MEADRVHKRVEEELRLERIETGILTETKSMLTDSNSTPVPPKNMELRFTKKISQPTLACHEIKGEGNTYIEVVLIDSSTENKVEAGPVAFANVEFVVLAQGTDDCAGEGFNEKIVTVEGKKPLLTVNLCQLQGGSCVLEDVKFRHHATQVKPTVFRLGARILGTFDGIIVKEAKTESFAVKCYRNKYFMKNDVPNLTDKIWVLRNIQRRGKIEERLQDKGIDTVEKFLIHLLINHQELKNIAGLKGKKLEGTVNHARNCQSDKMYWYFNSQENSGVVFDIFGKLQCVCSQEGRKVDADKLLSSAFGHWGDVTPFDDPDSLQQHLEDVKTSFNLSNSHFPGQYPDTGASEMVDGSNKIEVPVPLLDQGIPVSDMTSLERCESLGIHDFEVIDGFHWPLAHCESLSIHDFEVIDGFHWPLNQCFSTTFDVGCEVYDARIDGTGSAFAESKEVENEFLRIKMDLNRKKITTEANPARKKQKKC